MILHDPYALHRKWWDPDWTPGESSRDWTDWDYILADTYQLIDDFTDKESGQIMWFDQSGEVHWDVDTTTSGSLEAIERETGELKPGERRYAKPIFGDKKPTMQQWIADMAEGKADRRPTQARNSRPPTATELAALKSNKNSQPDSID